MNSELTALCATTLILVFMGLSAIVSIVVLRPSGENAQIIGTVATLIGPAILLFIQTFKTIQNGKNIEDIKTSTNGQTEHAIQQASKLATLEEKVESAKVAAEVAATTTTATAAALLKKEGKQ